MAGVTPDISESIPVYKKHLIPLINCHLVIDLERKPVINVPPPGPCARPIIEKDKKYLATSTKTAPIVVRRGSGVFVEDVDGNRYLDFTSGVGVLNVGHCHPAIVDAIRRQSELFLHYAGTDYYYSIQADLAEQLVSLTPGRFRKKVFYTNSGTESVEAALKLARWSTERPLFLAFIGAFHGRTMGALSLNASKPVHRARYQPMLPGVTHVPYAYCYRCPYRLEYPECDIWCARVIEEIYLTSFVPPEDLAAIFVEPLQGEGGYIVPPREFFIELKRIAQKYDILFIDDEVQAGFGRTGRWFAIEHYGVIPDIVCTAKGMGSGIPIGSIIFRAEYDWKAIGAHSNTFGGNPVACASSLATIETIRKEGLLANAEKQGSYLLKRLNELMDRYEVIGDVRGKGLMCATEIVKDKKSKGLNPKLRNRIEEECWKHGLIVLGCGKSSIRYIPPLIIQREHIDAAIEILEQAVKTCSA